MNEKKNTGLVIWVIILSVLVIGLVVYIVYDKTISESNNDVLENGEQEQINNSEKFEQKDKTYFDEYLSYFLPNASAGNFIKSIDNFTSEEITTYLHFYYLGKCNSGELHPTETQDMVYYNVSKKDMDQVVDKYFGNVKYEIIEKQDTRSGIKKLSEDEYQVYWFATGWLVPQATNIGVNYDGTNVEVKYSLTFENKNEGILIFNLSYNNGNYQVKSIKYEK